MTDNPEQGRRVRIGDAEREAAVNDLSEHFAAGRLTNEEHTERTSQAYEARTQADLDTLFSDLPGGRRGAAEEDHQQRHYGPPWAGQGAPPWAAWSGPGRQAGKPYGSAKAARWLPVPFLVLAVLGSACAIAHGFFPVFVIPLLAVAVTFFVLNRKGCFGGRGPA